MYKNENKQFLYDVIKIVLPVLLGFLFDGGLGYLKPSDTSKRLVFIFFITWFLIALFSFLRKKLIAYKMDKQADYAGFKTEYSSDYGRNSMVLTLEELGFIWRLSFTIPGNKTLKDLNNNKVKESDKVFKDLTGPYCPNDECELNNSMTFWGNYKYVCPKCEYKMISKKNKTTLKRDTIKILEAEKRKKIRS